MSFEQMLRDQVGREAGAVPLPRRDPDQAVRRAGSLRRRRRLVRGAAAGVAAAVAVAVAVPSVLSDEPGDLSVASPGRGGVVPTGPLDLDWRQDSGGLSNVRASLQGDDGVVYALSTGPGARSEDHPDGDVPRALYRLGEDGTWAPVELGGERPRALDMASGGGLLYAISTGPARGGGTAVSLSTSDDGGDTWSSQVVEPPAAPSTAVPWQVDSVSAVESNGSTTLAVINTTFFPDTEAVFPELADEEAGLAVEVRDGGLALVRYGSDGAVVVRPSGEREPDAARSGDPSVAGGAPEAEVVRTVTWAELGVDGPEALQGRTQLLRRAGDGWEPVETGAEALAALGAVDLQVAGDRFVASGWSRAGDRPAALASTDGTSWAPISVPGEGAVVAVGPALVHIPVEGVVLQVSGDAGGTWEEVDLADAGVPGDSVTYSYDGGPLGIALVASPAGGEGPDQLVVSGDLVDWTVTPLSEVLGMEEIGEVTTVVGEDRIVVTAAEPGAGGESVPESVTAVGTPVRAG